MLALSPTDTQGLIELCTDLIRTPSLPGRESAAARLLAGAMLRSGFHDVWTDAVGNVIGRYGAGRGPKLLLDGHMDTVDVGDPSAWTHDPYGGVIEDGVLFGRGAADMKSALAAMVYAVKLLADAGRSLNGDLYVAFVVQEEPCEGAGVQALIEEGGVQPDYVVLGEPTNLGLYVGQRGRVELDVCTYGRAGHSSMPQGGVNAVSGAARLLFSIELLASQLHVDPTLGAGSAAPMHIESNNPAGLNFIPDLCTFVLDRRLTLGETETRAITEIQQIIRREGLRARVRTREYELTTYTGRTLRGRKYFPPWLMAEDDPFVRKAARVVERVLGAPARIGVWPFSTDGAYTMGVAGIPTIGFGPGEERAAHTTDESVRLADVVTAAQMYAELALEVLR